MSAPWYSDKHNAVSIYDPITLALTNIFTSASRRTAVMGQFFRHQFVCPLPTTNFLGETGPTEFTFVDQGGQLFTQTQGLTLSPSGLLSGTISDSEGENEWSWEAKDYPNYKIRYLKVKAFNYTSQQWQNHVFTLRIIPSNYTVRPLFHIDTYGGLSFDVPGYSSPHKNSYFCVMQGQQTGYWATMPNCDINYRYGTSEPVCDQFHGCPQEAMSSEWNFGVRDWIPAGRYVMRATSPTTPLNGPTGIVINDHEVEPHAASSGSCAFHFNNNRGGTEYLVPPGVDVIFNWKGGEFKWQNFQNYWEPDYVVPGMGPDQSPVNVFFYEDIYGPTITSPASKSGKVGSMLTHQIIADGASSFSMEGAPNWVKIDPSTGVVRAIPPAVGTYTWTLRATASVLGDVQIFTFNVGVPNAPVVQSALFELPRVFIPSSVASEIAGFPVPDSFIPLTADLMYEELEYGDDIYYVPSIYEPTPFVLSPASYYNPNPVLTGFTLSQSLFNKTNHGLKNGTEIVFTDLGISETGSIFEGGVSKNYRYTVINASPNSFGITPASAASGSEDAMEAFSLEIKKSYFNIKIQIWDRKNQTYPETHYWSPAVLLSSVGQTLTWSGVTSSNNDFASLQIAGTSPPIITVSYPRATTTLNQNSNCGAGSYPGAPLCGPSFNPPRSVSYEEPSIVSVSASQAGTSSYQPTAVKLTWGATTFNNDAHLILFTIPSEIAVDQVAEFTVVSNKGLTPIYVTSDNPAIVQIVGAGPGGLFVGGQTKIKGIARGTTVILAEQPGNADQGRAANFVYVEVGRKAQTITFNLPSVVWEEGMEVALTASSNSGLPVTLKSSNGNIALFRGNTLVIMNQGSVDLIAEQAGDLIWAPAQVIRNIGVGSRSQTIFFNEFGVIRYGDPPFEIQAYSNSGLPLILTSSTPGVASVSFGTLLQINSVGSAVITANQPGDAYWRPAASVSRVVTIERGIPVITATVPSSIRVGPAYRVELTGVSSNSAPVRFFAESGSSSVLKVVEENDRYFVEGLTEDYGTVIAAVDVSTFYVAVTSRFSVLVGRAPQSISGETFFIQKFSDKFVEPELETTSFLPLTYEIVSGPGSVAADRINFTGVGVIVVNAFQPGNGEFKPSGLYQITIAVEKGVQSVLFPPLSPVLIGASKTLSAQAEGAGSIQFYSSTPSVVSVVGNVATGVTLGTVFILAITNGNSNYQAAAMVQPLTVVAPLASVNVTNPSAKDPESFSAFSVSPSFTGQTRQISRTPVDDEETHASTLLSSSTTTPPSSIARTLNDFEDFNSPSQSSPFTGASFELVDYPGRGDAEVAFLSFVPSANSGDDCFNMQSGGVQDSSDFSSLAASSTVSGGNCVIARFNMLEEFEPYTASWPIPPNGFIIMLSGNSTGCTSNWTGWLPAVSTVCAGESFIQSNVDLNGCSNVQERLAIGTKTGCPTNCISKWTDWTPSRYTVCQGVQFTQSKTDLNGCLPVQTRLITGLNGGCTAEYTFRVNIISIETNNQTANPPCPRVNTWAVGGAVSDFWTTAGVRTQVYTYNGVAGIDIFVWETQFVFQSATGNPVVEWQTAGGSADQQKLQIRYSTAGIYDIDIKVSNSPYQLVIDKMKVSYPNSNYFSGEANAVIPVPGNGEISWYGAGWSMQAKIDLAAGKIIEFRMSDGRLIWDINGSNLDYPKVEGSLSSLGPQTARIRPGDCDFTLKYDEEQTLDTTLGGPGDSGSDSQRLSSGEVRLESTSNT